MNMLNANYRALCRRGCSRGLHGNVPSALLHEERVREGIYIRMIHTEGPLFTFGMHRDGCNGPGKIGRLFAAICQLTANMDCS
jgi:hypothetical protein